MGIGVRACSKYWLKFLKSYTLYLLNLWMEVDHTCPDVRYWSEVLCCTIPTHMNDLEVKVMDSEKFILRFG